MRALVQRVSQASVAVGGATVSAIGPGLLVLLGVGRGDGQDEAEVLAGKVARLRVFDDENGRMNCSLLDTGGGALVVPQFTLLADTSRGNRPGFEAAAPPDEAERLFRGFCTALSEHGVPVFAGVFGANMEVSLVNLGPVTILLEREGKRIEP